MNSKRYRFKILLAGFILFSIASPASYGLSVDDLFPSNPLVFLKTPNMTALIDSYLASDFGKNYIQSAGFSDFSRSKLYLKLSDRVKQWEELSGLQLHINLIREFAGTESSLAIYDIGEIHILFASAVTYPQVEKSKLYRLKTKFESRKAGDVDYFIKEGSDGRHALAFTYVKNMFILSTSIPLIEKSIQLLNRGSSASLSEDQRFKTAMNDLDGDITLFMDLGKLASDRYFTTYWIYQNNPAFKWIETGSASIKFSSCGANEIRRYFPFKDAEIKSNKISDNYLINYIPPEFDYIILGTSTDIDEACREIMQTAWNLPSVDFEKQNLKDWEKELLEVRNDLMNLLTKHPPQEMLRMVLSGKSTDLFKMEIANPVILKMDGVTMQDMERILSKAASAISKLTSLMEAETLTIKKETTGRWDVRYIETPLLTLNKPAISINEGIVGFCCKNEVWNNYLKSNGKGFNIDSDLALFAQLNFNQTGTKFFNTIELISKGPGWNSTTDHEIFTKNLKSLFGIFKNITRIIVKDRLKKGFIERNISYICQ